MVSQLLSAALEQKQLGRPFLSCIAHGSGFCDLLQRTLQSWGWLLFVVVVGNTRFASPLPSSQVLFDYM